MASGELAGTQIVMKPGGGKLGGVDPLKRVDEEGSEWTSCSSG